MSISNWQEKYKGFVHILISMPEKIICGVYESKDDAQEWCDHLNLHNDIKGLWYRIESKPVERRVNVNGACIQ